MADLDNKVKAALALGDDQTCSAIDEAHRLLMPALWRSHDAVLAKREGRISRPEELTASENRRPAEAQAKAQGRTAGRRIRGLGRIHRQDSVGPTVHWRPLHEQHDGTD